MFSKCVFFLCARVRACVWCVFVCVCVNCPSLDLELFKVWKDCLYWVDIGYEKNCLEPMWCPGLWLELKQRPRIWLELKHASWKFAGHKTCCDIKRIWLDAGLYMKRVWMDAGLYMKKNWMNTGLYMKRIWLDGGLFEIDLDGTMKRINLDFN